jgi:hypothetical protein
MKESAIIVKGYCVKQLTGITKWTSKGLEHMLFWDLLARAIQSFSEASEEIIASNAEIVEANRT